LNQSYGGGNPRQKSAGGRGSWGRRAGRYTKLLNSSEKSIPKGIPDPGRGSGSEKVECDEPDLLHNHHAAERSNLAEKKISRPLRK